MSFHIENRKVQQTGGSSFIISLPKEWINEHNIKKGDSLSILSQPDGNLMISPYASSQKYVKEKIINVDKDTTPDYLFRLLVGVYIMGFSRIIIQTTRDRFEQPIKEVIDSFVKITIGTEIIEGTANKIIIKDLVNPKEMPFDKTIKQMYIKANDMHEDAVRALESADKILAQKVIDRDDDLDRLNWLVERQSHIVLRDVILCQKMNITLEDASNFQHISKSLERIGDHAVKIAQNVLKLDYEKIDKTLFESIMEASKISLELLNISLDAWLQKNIMLANENIESIKILTAACEKITFNSENVGKNAVEIGYIIESIRRTGEYSADISEIIINNLI